MSEIKLQFQNKIQTPKGLAVLLITSLLLLYSIYSIYVWMNSQTTDNAYVDGNITFVSPQVMGVVEQINFVENQKVKKGDVLVKINDIDYKAQLSVATNDLALQKITLDSINTKIQIAELQIENASREYNRTSRLAQDNFSSKKLLEDSALALKTEQLELSLLQSEKQSTSSMIQKAEDALKMAQNDYDNTTITAPFDGVVTSNSARIGGYVRTGSPIFALVPANNFYVKANFKETQVVKLKEGMEAHLKFDAIKGVNFKGKIRNIYPATGSKFALIPTDNATGNFTKIVQKVPVIIDVEVPEEYKGKIGIGYSVDVSIRTDQ